MENELKLSVHLDFLWMWLMGLEQFTKFFLLVSPW